MSYLGRSAKLSLKAQEKVSFLATAGQTVKTGLSYVPNFVEVYVNGILLTDTTDFTATNGNSVTFTVALALNDEVTVISLKTFTVADHYTKSDANTLLAAKAPIASPSFTGGIDVSGAIEAESTSIDVLKLNRATANGDTNLILQSNGADTAKIHALSVGDLAFHTGASGSLTEKMRINASGIVTKPLQPAFQAYKSSTNSNKTPNAEHVVIFGAENFDIGSNFAANYFTAPVTGKYQLTTNVRAGPLDSAAAYYQIRIVTSNRAYYSIFDPDFGQDNNYWTLSCSILADMDAGDTAYVGFYQNGGSAQTDLDGDQKYTNFSGFLAC